MKANQQKETIANLFAETVSNIQWLSIDNIYEAVSQNSELSERLLSGDAKEKAIKHICRQMLRNIKDEKGNPLYASIVEKDEKGNEQRVWKQTTLFNLEDYPQVVNYHSQQVIHHAREAARYAKEYKEKTAIQLHLPFDESAILLD